MALSFPAGSDTLAPGRHRATMAEVEAVLVDGIAGSRTRRPIFERWKAVREAITRIVSVETEWIDGSYVTTKQDPADIDVVTHVDGDELDGLDDPAKAMLLGLMAGHQSRRLHACDSFCVPVYPQGHALYPHYEQAFRYWDKWFGVDRAGQAKGYVEVADGP